MRIRLISGDQFLCKLCREVLLGFRDREWDFGMIASYEQARWADLFIWDLHPETQLPQNSDFDPRRRNIFLIARKHVGTLQRRLPLRPGGMGLPPSPEAGRDSGGSQGGEGGGAGGGVVRGVSGKGVPAPAMP